MPDQPKLIPSSMSNASSFHSHDHENCIHDGLKAAEDRCSVEKLQLTPVRRRVLEILLHRHSAMGAYEILDILREEGLGSQPPVAYRALEFLTRNGFAHKIERLNAFVACAHSDLEHVPAFLICTSCNVVAEAPSQNVDTAMRDSAGDLGFSINRMVVEAEGTCPACLPEGETKGGISE